MLYLETPVTEANAQALDPLMLASWMPPLAWYVFSACRVRLPIAEATESPVTSLPTKPQFSCPLLRTVLYGVCMLDTELVFWLPIALLVGPVDDGVLAVALFDPPLPDALAALEQLKLFWFSM